MASVEDRVIKVVADQLGCDEKTVTPEKQIVADLGADSLDQVELVMALEEEFDIKIVDEDADKIKTVKDAIEFINKQKA